MKVVPHPLAGFKLRAVVDWIELRVTLPQPSQPRHIRARMPDEWGEPYAHPEDGLTTSRTFTFRIQDPGPPDAVLRQLQALGRTGPIGEDAVQVMAIEIALDAFPTSKSASSADLVQAALHLLRHHAHPPDAVPKACMTKVAFQCFSRMEAESSLSKGYFTINTGEPHKLDEAGDPYTTRTYCKTHDFVPDITGGVGARREVKSRARFEVTLSGAEAPFSTVQGWREFKFEDCMERFAMVKPEHCHPLVALMREWKLSMGSTRRVKDVVGHRRTSRIATSRDTLLNRRIKDALRQLTKSTRRASAEIRER